MRKLLAIMLALTLTTTLLACTSGGQQIQAIQERGILRVGVKVDVPNFGYLNPETKEMEGMEIDLARAIAYAILGDETAVKFVGLTAETRGPLLDNGEVDIVIATFTITEERKELFNFTEPYYVDQIGFLVRKDSGLTRIDDMDGRTIGVAQAGTGQQALLDECESRGIEVNCIAFASYPEIKAALLDGQVDAFVVDKSILSGYVDSQTMVIDEGFKPQNYGIAIALYNNNLARYLDSLLKQMKTDGTIDTLFEKWGVG